MGDRVGASEGDRVGASVGDKEGDSSTLITGRRVGRLVGFSEGDKVGANVGDRDGLGVVGRLVGLGVCAGTTGLLVLCEQRRMLDSPISSSSTKKAYY